MFTIITNRLGYVFLLISIAVTLSVMYLICRSFKSDTEL